MSRHEKPFCGGTQQQDKEQAPGTAAVPEETVTEAPQTAGAEADALREEVEKQKDEIKKLKDEVARGRADYFNLRSRVERDRENNAKLASEQAVREMLPVFENIERISAAIEDREGNLAKGMTMVIKQFADGLEKLGLEFIPVEGEFDPTLHEAVYMEPVAEAEKDGHITGALCRGYKLAGRVIKAPQVKVGKFNG